MKKFAALAAAAVVLLPACQDSLAPREPGIRKPGQPMLDHGSTSFAIANQGCGFSGPYYYGPVFECYIVVRHGDGTSSSYGNGTLVFDENGDPSGVPSWVLRPTWSPDATKIAADNDDDVLVVTLSDGSFANLTNHPAHDQWPAWSPNGAQIAFVSDRDGQPSIYLMNATNGGNVTRVTNGVEVRGKPTWSPNSSRLAFTCIVEPPFSDVCAVNANGSGFARLTTTRADGGPDWSPDGTRIAFLTGRFGTGTTEVATMAPDGSNVTRISRPGPSAQYYGPGYLDWSPDGTRIAYSRDAFQPIACDASGPCWAGPALFVMNADGSGVSIIGGGANPEWQPGVSGPPPAGDQPPVARLTNSCTYLECWFYGYTSTDDHGISSYGWTFGDGTGDLNYNSPYSVQFHRYQAPGTYTVTLRVTDWGGQASTVTQTVTVSSAPNVAPVANFSSFCGGSFGRYCSFNSSGSTDDVGIVSRTWSFGDGSSLNDVIAPNHAYTVNGTYQVTLTVRDAAGLSNSATSIVTVRDDAPVARFTYSCTSRTCTFDGTTSTDDIGIASYWWDFGRYGIVNASSATITLKGRASFTATLTVMDQAGQTNSTTQTITPR